MTEIDSITETIQSVWDEMKTTGLWKKQPPGWVSEFREINIITEHDFSEWLQFVYLPNLVQQVSNNCTGMQKGNIVPQALMFFGEDVRKGKLLQLLIELDSLQ